MWFILTLSHRSSSSVYSTILSRGSVSDSWYLSWVAMSCLFLRLSVCLSASVSPEHDRSSPNFCACVIYCSCSVLVWRRCDTLCISGLWMTSCLRIMGNTEACRYRCGEWRHCVVVRRLTPLLCRIGCAVSIRRRRAPSCKGYRGCELKDEFLSTTLVVQIDQSARFVYARTQTWIKWWLV